MNPFIRRMAFVLMFACVFALSAASFVMAALAPETHYLGRITGVVAPVRLAADPFGKLYVADPRSGGVLQFDNAGNPLKTFPVKGACGVAITSAGELVVTHGSTASVINTSTGAALFSLAPFKQANGVTVDDSGRIFVVDTLDSVIKVFLGSGQYSFSFGATGTSSEKLSLPTAIAFDTASKQIVVADTGNSRLAFFDNKGVFVRSLGGKAQNGTAPVFTSPQSVALEYTKTSPQQLQRIYVSDSFQSEVQIVDPQGLGASLASIGGYGTKAGKLKVPVDALFDAASSRLFIANGAGEITLYGINVATSPTPDTTPPTLTLDATPATTGTNAVVIGGTVEKEATVQITAPFGVVMSAVSYFPAQSDSLAYWQTSLSNLTSGANVITVIARDSAANAASQTATITYNPDTVKVGINDFATPVNLASQTLTGTKDQNSTVSLSGSAGVTFGQITSPTPTTWSSTVSNLTEGINTITATAARTGASSSSATTRITLLTIKPSLEVSMLPSGSSTTQPLLNVTGLLPNMAYISSLTVNGVEVKVNNNAFSTTVTLNPNINNIITVAARDTAGNLTIDSRTIIFNESLPVIAVTEPADGTYVSSTNVTIKGTVTNGTNVQLTLNDGATFPVVISAGVWTATDVPLEQGLNTIIVKAGSSSTAKLTITRDASVPALAATEPKADKSLNIPATTVSGTVSAGTEMIATVKSATLNSTPVPVTVTVNADGTYSVPVSFTKEEQYTLAITATDALGNSVTTYRNLIYDITAPKVETVVETPSSLKVTFSEGTPEITYDSVVLQPGTDYTVISNSDGSKTVEINPAVVTDPKKLDIHSLDAAGNSTRNGDVNGNGKVDITDAMAVLRLSLGLDPITLESKLRGDVATASNGATKPDGVFDIFDVINMLYKIVGL
ncbi:MAG: hypothetical protein ACOYL3_10995 [Desulfuromonadaceae bacterium]